MSRFLIGMLALLLAALAAAVVVGLYVFRFVPWGAGKTFSAAYRREALSGKLDLWSKFLTKGSVVKVSAAFFVANQSPTPGALMIRLSTTLRTASSTWHLSRCCSCRNPRTRM